MQQLLAKVPKQKTARIVPDRLSGEPANILQGQTMKPAANNPGSAFRTGLLFVLEGAAIKANWSVEWDPVSIAEGRADFRKRRGWRSTYVPVLIRKKPKPPLKGMITNGNMSLSDAFRAGKSMKLRL